MEKVRIGRWEVAPEHLIWTEEALVDLLTGWDYSDWEWTMPPGWRGPDVVPVTAAEILVGVPSPGYVEEEWVIFGDLEVPFAVRREVDDMVRFVELYLVRVQRGPGTAVGYSLHGTKEEAQAALEELTE